MRSAVTSPSRVILNPLPVSVADTRDNVSGVTACGFTNTNAVFVTMSTRSSRSIWAKDVLD